jgi:hypothetical protein
VSGVTRVAVVGGGIFGVTAAIELARSGYEVDLLERNSDLLRAASGINQFRLHRGYHYPRSADTAVSCKASEVTFRSAYAAAVRNDSEHYYAISPHDSLTTPEAFVQFCATLGLEHERAAPAMLKQDRVALCVRVRESLFDAAVLREICRAELQRSGVRVHLGTAATTQMLDGYDFRILATYASLNELIAGRRSRLFQFEICEKPVVRLPDTFRRKSVVILDGPFMCIDPMGARDLFVLGNVVHAIHASNVGELPEVPPALRPLLNAGIVQRSTTKFPLFVEAAREFFSGIEEAQHVGSMFTIRTVLPGTDRTDERPTLVERIDDRTITIFSGKITTCVEAAREVVGMLDGIRASGSASARRS